MRRSADESCELRRGPKPLIVITSPSFFSFPDMPSVRGAIDNSIGWGMAATGDFVARDDFFSPCPSRVRALLLHLWYDDAIRIWAVLHGMGIEEEKARLARASEGRISHHRFFARPTARPGRSWPFLSMCPENWNREAKAD